MKDFFFFLNDVLLHTIKCGYGWYIGLNRLFFQTLLCKFLVKGLATLVSFFFISKEWDFSWNSPRTQKPIHDSIIYCHSCGVMECSHEALHIAVWLQDISSHIICVLAHRARDQPKLYFRKSKTLQDECRKHLVDIKVTEMIFLSPMLN